MVVVVIAAVVAALLKQLQIGRAMCWWIYAWCFVELPYYTNNGDKNKWHGHLEYAQPYIICILTGIYTFVFWCAWCFAELP